MKLLALDTSSVACSVAVQIDGQIVDRHEEQAREHTRLLLPMIKSVLEEADLDLADLDAIVLGNGPGSFIGMRIAASVSQGLAFGAGLQIVPVSSMAAVAAQAFAETDASVLAVAQDAHMQEVYLGVYSADDDRQPIELQPEQLHPQIFIEGLAGNIEVPVFAAGFGWTRYPALAEANRSQLSDLLPILHPTARWLLPLGRRGMESGTAIEPSALVPAYLRQKVAQQPSTVRT